MIRTTTIPLGNSYGNADDTMSVSFALQSAVRGELGSVERVKPTDTHLLLLVEVGQGTIWLGEDGYRLFPGRCFLKPPGVSVRTAVDDGETVIACQVEFIGYRLASVGTDDHTQLVPEPFRLPVSGEVQQSELSQAIRSLCQPLEGGAERQRFGQHRQFLALVDRIWEARSCLSC